MCDLIEAGLNESAGYFGAMGSCHGGWRDCSEDGRATAAKALFWRGRPRVSGTEREKQVRFSCWPDWDRVLRQSIGIAGGLATGRAASSVAVMTTIGSYEIMTYHNRIADR